MNLRTLRVVVAIALGCVTSAAHAWSPRGHAVVAGIATRLLTPQAAAEVDRLLVGDLAADGTPSGRTTLEAVASWPDEIRLVPEFRSTGAYHFDAMQVCSTPDPAVYCKDGRCASAWFARQLAILRDRTQPPRARNEALKWIVHLVGDLHQPLHAAENEDAIGDGVQVRWFGARSDVRTGVRIPYPYHLHTTWDRLIPYRMLDERGGDRAFVADLPDAVTRRAWEAGSIAAWVAESHELARTFVYPALPAPPEPSDEDRGPFTCGRRITQVRDLADDYYRPAATIAAAQLRKAGVRLAKLLNDVLGP